MPGDNMNPCPYCGTLMNNPRRKQCGAAECKRAFNADRMRKWQRDYKAQHGQWYPKARHGDRQREYSRKRYQEQPHWRVRYPERAALIDARRRMRILDASQGEVFAPAAVHARNGWTCQLCHEPIDPDVAWPDPMSPSIDHVIPLARGGEHSMGNVQSAHLGCNSSKGDRVDPAPQVPAQGGQAGMG
ncbi:HNH endonuclease [Streptomyces albidoflavus]|uniref:HNH endonuclease n=1 Tax=Streptomyces albidoflavus TaxID=1886 RepID=UPI003440BD67